MVENQVFEQRLSRLRAALYQAGMRAAILSRPQHVFYFTGIMPGPSPVLLLITQERELAIAPAALGSCETLMYTDYDIYRGWNVVEAVAGLLDQGLSDLFPVGRVVGLEMDHLPAAWMPYALRHIRQPRDIRQLLWEIRRAKDEVELRQIEANIAGNDRIFERIQEALRPGVSELEIWSIIQTTLCENAGEPVVLEGDLGVGVRASNPDAKPGRATIRSGDSVFVDVYSASHHYYADTTRVFCVGQPDGQQQAIFAILLEALQAGETWLRPGILANQVDAAVRGVIQKAGYADNFPHHSGHAYGLFQQEKPYFIPADDTPLDAGMIVTLEPGIYIAGWGGMRLEGNYLIRPGAARRLDHFPSELCVV